MTIWTSVLPTRLQPQAASWSGLVKQADCVAWAVPSASENVPVAGGAEVVDVTIMLASYRDVFPTAARACLEYLLVHVFEESSC